MRHPSSKPLFHRSSRLLVVPALALIGLGALSCAKDDGLPQPNGHATPPQVVQTSRGKVTWRDGGQALTGGLDGETGGDVGLARTIASLDGVEFEEEEQQPRFGGTASGAAAPPTTGAPAPRESRSLDAGDEGAEFADDGDGDLRARTENVFDRSGLGELEQDFDAEIAQAAGIGGPSAGSGGGGGRTFPGEDINLDPTGEFVVEEEKLSKSKDDAPAKTWKRSTLVPNSSRLLVGDEDTLPLTGMQASVRIDGARARVVLDCFYVNDREQQLEGRFQLRLPNEASPWYLAFGQTEVTAQTSTPAPVFFSQAQAAQLSLRPDAMRTDRGPSWTGVKEARMVPKAKAAHAYGQMTRQRVDPALMEWAGAGMFEASVFPLMPGQLHRIVIGYDVDLDLVGDDLVYRLDLPGGTHTTNVVLDVPETDGINVSLEGGSATSREGRRHLHFASVDQREVTVRYADADQPVLTGTDATGSYFTHDFTPELPKTEAASSSRAVLMIDTSLSSNPERMAIWRQMTEALLTNNRGTLQEVAVLEFGVDQTWWREGFVTNDAANTRELLAHLDDVALEGATDLGSALRSAAAPAWLTQTGAPYDVFLLSDGAATWGEDDAYALSQSLKTDHVGALFAYRTGIAGTADGVLTHLARETGGAVFSIVGEDAVAEASRAHQFRPWMLERIGVSGGSDLVLAGRPTALFPGQRLRVAGRGAPASGSPLRLTLRQGERETTISVPLDGTVESPLAARTYGSVATAQLEELGEATADASRAYASHFRVVGKTCSLLMLETEEDYQRFDIRPEDDAAVVRSQETSLAVLHALDAQAQRLGDPRAQLLDWLDRVLATDWLGVKLPDGLREMLEALPRETFDVPSSPLVTTVRTWDQVPGNVQEELAARKPTYDTMSAEAKRRLAANGAAAALEALSSLVEQEPGRFDLVRDIGYSALEWNRPDQAHHLFRKVARARPNEPQSYRGLAQCLDRMGRADLAVLYYEIALGGAWDGRFGAFRRICAFDYLRLIGRIERGEVTGQLGEFARGRKAEVAQIAELTKADLVVFVTWNTDRTDVDLHVLDPRKEHCFYGQNTTTMGGLITQDVTQGYGPEMFVLPKADAGKYEIGVKYFSSDESRTSLRTRVLVTVVQGWGSADASESTRTITLAGREEVQHIATVDVTPSN